MSVLLSYLHLCTTLLTYTITGVVLDKETERPVPDVHVFINNSTLGTITDKDGQYELRFVPANAKEIAISALGYETVVQSIPLGNTESLRIDFDLEPSTLQMENVEILALN